MFSDWKIFFYGFFVSLILFITLVGHYVHSTPTATTQVIDSPPATEQAVKVQTQAVEQAAVQDQHQDQVAKTEVTTIKYDLQKQTKKIKKSVQTPQVKVKSLGQTQIAALQNLYSQYYGSQVSQVSASAYS